MAMLPVCLDLIFGQTNPYKEQSLEKVPTKEPSDDSD